MSTASPDKPKPAISRGEVYRQARIWHGYLSAIAFLALMFFAVTGILLNHPGWPKVTPPAPVETRLTLSAVDLAAVKAAAEPGLVLVTFAAAKTDLAGAFKEGEAVGDDLFVRLQGVRGSSDLRANLLTGEVEVLVERNHPVAIFNGLHRGEQAGAAWRFLIDAFGVVLIVLSLIGYVLFLSLRFRLKTALALTAASLIVMVGVFLAAVN